MSPRRAVRAMVRLSVSLDAEHYEVLCRTARGAGLSTSAVARIAIAQGLEATRRKVARLDTPKRLGGA